MATNAIDGVTCEIPDGQFIGLIGHTGSGKSTLVQTMNGLLRPSSGKILYNGEDIWGENYDRRKLRAEVGLVFQYPEHQLFEADVLTDVKFGPKNLGLSQEEQERRAKKALELVGMGEEYYEVSPFELSGGQKRRAAIAGVLAMEPKIMILDEPTAGLDPKGRDEILGLVSDMHTKLHMTIVHARRHSARGFPARRRTGKCRSVRAAGGVYLSISETAGNEHTDRSFDGG